MAPDAQPQLADLDGRVPLVIGVTGHRDVHPEDVSRVQSQVTELLQGLRTQCPHTPITVMSGLAEGADRIVARAAMSLGIHIVCVLPMPLDTYRSTFSSDEARTEFDELLSHASIVPVFALPSSGDAVSDEIRKYRFAPLSQFLATVSFLLLAVWDGDTRIVPGGTADTVRRRLSRGRPLDANWLAPTEAATAASDDVVCWLPVRRVRAEPTLNPEPARARMQFLGAGLLRPQYDLPESHVVVIGRVEELNRDIAAVHAANPADLPATDSLQTRVGGVDLLAQVLRRREYLGELAVRYRRRLDSATRLLAVLGLFVGVCWAAFLQNLPVMVFAVLALLTLGLVGSWAVRRRDWNRKALEYRSLAEMTRVQVHWRLAGVGGLHTHDTDFDLFARTLDLDLMWIEVAAMSSEVDLATVIVPETPAALDFAVRNWLGTDDTTGQIGYFHHAIRRHGRAVRVLELTGRVVVTVAWVTVAYLAVVTARDLLDPARVAAAAASVARALASTLWTGLTMLTAVVGVVVLKRADRELLRQYRAMLRMFSSARSTVSAEPDPVKVRGILRRLGKLAIRENLNWLLLHRDQPRGGFRLKT